MELVERVEREGTWESEGMAKGSGERVDVKEVGLGDRRGMRSRWRREKALDDDDGGEMRSQDVVRLIEGGVNPGKTSVKIFYVNI